MTKVLDDAIEKIRELPEERHAYAATMLELIAAQDVYRLSDAERREVQAGLDEMARGDIATDAEVAATWKRFEI
jgi:hypothetical protein